MRTAVLSVLPVAENPSAEPGATCILDVTR